MAPLWASALLLGTSTEPGPSAASLLSTLSRGVPGAGLLRLILDSHPPPYSAGLRRLAQTNQARGQTDTVSDCSLVSRVDSVGPPALSGRRPGLASLGMPIDNGWEEGARIKVRRNEKTFEIDTTDQGAETRE